MRPTTETLIFLCVMWFWLWLLLPIVEQIISRHWKDYKQHKANEQTAKKLLLKLAYMTQEQLNNKQLSNDYIARAGLNDSDLNTVKEAHEQVNKLLKQEQ